MSANKLIVSGTPVVKGPLALPATATSNLFVVSGAVYITGLIGLVTTATGATATTLSLGTTGTTATSIATATSVASKPVGSWIAPASGGGLSAAGALVVISGPAFTGNNASVPDSISPFLCAADTITWTTSATDTGAIKWYLWYVPLDPAATVV